LFIGDAQQPTNSNRIQSPPQILPKATLARPHTTTVVNWPSARVTQFTL
jgi:hypothetical protein